MADTPSSSPLSPEDLSMLYADQCPTAMTDLPGFEGMLRESFAELSEAAGV